MWPVLSDHSSMVQRCRHHARNSAASLRRETAPDSDVMVLRGGPDSIDKLRQHARRTARAWSLDGHALLGISVFCALDDIGPASLDGLLTGRLCTYGRIHICAAGALRALGAELLPTGQRPHFTVHLGDDDDRQLAELLACFGAAQDNRPDTPGRLRRRGRPGR